MTDKQPHFGDMAENNKGNDGYGFEEHESFAKVVNGPIPKPIKIRTEEGNQPVFGDGATNSPGNNGYGYDEREQFVGEATPIVEPDVAIDEPESDPIDDVNARIMITAGSNIADVMSIANDFRMEYLGVAHYDDGEKAYDEDSMDEIAAHFFANPIPNKSRAFVKNVEQNVSGAVVKMTTMLGPEDSQNTEFGLDFDGLDLPEEDLGV